MCEWGVGEDAYSHNIEVDLGNTADVVIKGRKYNGISPVYRLLLFCQIYIFLYDA